MIVPRILCNFPIPEDSEGSICRSPVSQAPYQSPAKTSPRKRGISTIGSEENIQHISTHTKVTKVVPRSWTCFRSSLNQVLLADISVNQRDLKRPRHTFSPGEASLCNRKKQPSMGMAYPTLLCIYMVVSIWKMVVFHSYVDGNDIYIYTVYIYIYTGWWFQPTPLKNMMECE